MARVFAATLLLFIAAGCVPVEQKPVRPSVTVQNSASPGADGKPDRVDVVLPASPGVSGKAWYDSIDPCGAKMDVISERLVMFFSANHRLPDKLEDLTTAAEREKKQGLECPHCNKPYVYVPPPIIPTSAQRLICYAPVPDPQDGKIRAIILRPAAGSPMGSAPVVMQLTRDQLNHYLKTVAATAQ